jgi:hypothetical protein
MDGERFIPYASELQTSKKWSVVLRECFKEEGERLATSIDLDVPRAS